MPIQNRGRMQDNGAAQINTATCRLCGQLGELQDGHILPAFVFKWLKETSGTGFIRFSQEPDRRVQDGHRRRWLCLSCERLLNAWETQFATNLFHPLNEDGGRRVRYREWLLRFCVSVSWRSLSMLKDIEGLGHFTQRQLARLIHDGDDFRLADVA